MTGMVPADKQKVDPQDVTECRRKAIEAEQEYRALFDHAGVGIGYYRPDGTIIWYNELAANYMGDTWLKITVEDHGAGIPESVQDRIFNPFLRQRTVMRAQAWACPSAMGSSKNTTES